MTTIDQHLNTYVYSAIYIQSHKHPTDRCAPLVVLPNKALSSEGCVAGRDLAKNPFGSGPDLV